MGKPPRGGGGGGGGGGAHIDHLCQLVLDDGHDGASRAVGPQQAVRAGILATGASSPHRAAELHPCHQHHHQPDVNKVVS